MKPPPQPAQTPGHAPVAALAGRRTRPLATLAALAAASLLASACASPSATGESAAPRPVTEAQADARAAAPGAAARAGDAPPAETLPQVELTPQLVFQLLASEIAAQRGDVGSAATTYLSMARQTRDPRLARRATELALVERSLDHALPAAELWHELSPNSPIATQTIESLWITTGRLDEAEPLLRARLEKARADRRLPETYGQLQRALSRAPDGKAALAMLERLSAPDAKVPAARLALAAVAHAADDVGRAASEAEAALKLEPKNEDAAIAAARYVAQTPRGSAGAIALLESFVAREPKAIEARFSLARLLAAVGRRDDARAQFENALKQEPDSPGILFSLAQLAYQTKQPKVAEDYLRRYLELPSQVQRDNDPAYLFMGQLAEEAGRTTDAIDWYARVRRGEQFLPALTRRAVLLGKLGRVDEARELLRSTSVGSVRERVQLTTAEAQVLREAGRDADALEVLAQALERHPENPELLYDHAMAAERVDKLDAMEKSLRKLIALRPDYAHAYNALGYTFAERNVRLDEAQALIEKALELAPNDAHIIDSMGWVLFRRGRFADAVAQLERAYGLRPEAEIAAHLGEALWQAGRAEDAQRVWREAAAREPGNKVLNETLARFKIKR
ncbi:MAG: tetratricopeptide repeat protein [Burkholderiaceae bacterium]|nr:tetratricopeptide repeat protein [Burkholderiaceae bacterium]